MKITNINNTISAKQSQNNSIKHSQTNSISNVDLFQKSNNIAFKSKYSSEKINQYLDFLAQKKDVRQKSKQALNRIEAFFTAKRKTTITEIKKIEQDADFISETISDAERMDWENKLYDIYDSKTLTKTPSSKAKEEALIGANELILSKRAKNIGTFLEEAPTKLDNPENDKKYQKLLKLYRQKMNLPIRREEARIKVANTVNKQLETINSQIAILTGNGPIEMGLEAIRTAKKTDPKIRKIWSNAYNNTYEKLKPMQKSTDYIISSAVNNANLTTIRHLQGMEDSPV